MAAIDLENIACRYLRNSIIEQFTSASSNLPAVPVNIVVPGGEINYATTKEKVNFRGKCGMCDVRFAGEAKLRPIEGAHLEGDSAKKVRAYTVIYPTISVQKSGQCLDEATKN
jgi:ribosomal protein L34E